MGLGFTKIGIGQSKHGTAVPERRNRMAEWISVKDRLPEKTGKQRGFYLVALSNGVVKELAYEFEHYNNMLFDVGWHETAYPVTHWMPLPEPPKEADRD